MKDAASALTDMQVLHSLKSVIDPELMVNIVDLGMIYNIKINFEINLIEVEMTLTSKGCPLGDVITQHATEVLKAHYPTFTNTINIVWEPAWNPAFITKQGKIELG